MNLKAIIILCSKYNEFKIKIKLNNYFINKFFDKCNNNLICISNKRISMLFYQNLFYQNLSELF